jgi:hypothetical protein
MGGLRLEVTDVAPIPASSKKEKSARQGRPFRLPRWTVALQDQIFIGLADLLVSDNPGIDGIGEQGGSYGDCEACY